MRLTERSIVWLLGIGLGIAGPSLGAGRDDSKPAVIAAGEFFPHYGPGGSKKAVQVARFTLDRVPVTMRRYADFLKAETDWLPGRPPELFAEAGYLTGWKKTATGGALPPATKLDHPVTHVSYFAAAAFCKWAGGRLPTTLEWEFAAQEKAEELLGWFANPKPPGVVAKGKPNRHGVYDLHGQVWEWTQDFNSSFASADNREDGERDKNLFCGAGSMNARDRENYPAFMRYAMRGGLRSNYVMGNLGFRCAYDEK